MSHDLDRRLLIGAAGLAGVAALSKLAHAGPLSPPGGAVISTSKPLSEVEPRMAVNATNTPGDAASVFRITQQGSYYLTGNVTAPAGLSGVAIVATGVTLDLNGFTITGNGGSSPAGVILTAGSCRVRNGFITACNRGVYGTANTIHVEGLRITSCVTAGIELIGNALVTACEVTQASGSGSHAIVTGPTSTVLDCVAQFYGGVLFSVGSNSLVQRCVGNLGGTGVSGAGILPANVSVIDCVMQGMTNGILLGNGALVRGCNLRTVGSTSVVAYGIQVGNSATVQDCTIHDAIGAPSTTSAAISCTGEAAITNCTIAANAGGAVLRGIVTNGGLVQGCSLTIIGNGSIGIQAGSGSLLISGNKVFAGGTGSVGVSSGSGNTICDNHVIAPTAIDLAGNGGNHVVRNFIHSSALAVNSSNPGGNIIGPSLAPAGVAASSNPHANYVL